MYSVVIMVAMTGGADLPVAIGRGGRHGCHSRHGGGGIRRVSM